MTGYILAIDQGTTSSRAILFDPEMKIVGSGQKEFTQHYPASGWVEHDPEEIWSSVVATVKAALKSAGRDASDVAAIGITNQRETVVIWDRATAKPIHNAIVWQDRRTAPLCQNLKKQGLEKKFTRRTGLLLDNIEKNAWDDELLAILGIPGKMLPQVKDCADDYGITEKSLFGAEIRILGVAGDQHAATIGQACFEPGMMKSTYGTGCFALLNTGSDLVRSKNRLLTTIAYRLNGKTTYALEGSIFIAGAAVQWLRDGIKVIGKAEQSGVLAASADPTQEVYLVPAFVGLGAPHWDAEARGAIFGLTRNSGPAEFASAALESVAFQTRDLLDAMRKDWKGASAKTVLRVDGGMVASDWTLQRLADILDAPVDRPTILETTALGAAWLAGSKAGVWPKARDFARSWALERRFKPDMNATVRSVKLAGWRDAVRRTLSTL
ncbi:MAG: glycerol kinase [Mesorhizobium sp.]|nr:MAG: glycerol kinase [Mesorhizobium sp.]